jgi:hypothetical protein
VVVETERPRDRENVKTKLLQFTACSLNCQSRVFVDNNDVCVNLIEHGYASGERPEIP